MATDSVITAIDQCKKCIDEKRSFVLQGGAGSGKTESLKELLIYINQTNPKAKVMCITHTNVAVNEILSRTGNAFPVSTIHSFLNSLIKDYNRLRKNIREKTEGFIFCAPKSCFCRLSSHFARLSAYSTVGRVFSTLNLLFFSRVS